MAGFCSTQLSVTPGLAPTGKVGNPRRSRSSTAKEATNAIHKEQEQGVERTARAHAHTGEKAPVQWRNTSAGEQTRGRGLL